MRGNVILPHEVCVIDY